MVRSSGSTALLGVSSILESADVLTAFSTIRRGCDCLRFSRLSVVVVVVDDDIESVETSMSAFNTASDTL